MGTESLEEVGTIIRSILTTEKSGVPLRRLDGEYRTLTGSRIPYHKLGFSTLEAYIESVPDVARFGRNAQGETVVTAVASASTAHVAQMVRGQKSTKSKPMLRKTYRRPISQQHVGYRPNSLLTALSRSTYKQASSTSTGERRRPGYEYYRPPAQRGVTTGHARQSTAYGSHKQDQSPIQKSGSFSKNSTYSALAPEQRQQSRYEAPPRFQKAVAPRSHEERKPSVTSSTGKQPSADEPSKTLGGGQGGWGELNNSWTARPRLVKSAAQHWEFGIAGGDTGDSHWSTTGPAAAAAATAAAAAAQGGSEEPTQPVATATASKSLGGTPVSKPPAAPTSVVTPLRPAMMSKPTEQRPKIEPDQDRFNPFRQPLQLDLIPPSSMLEEKVSTVSAPVVPAPVPRELGISLGSFTTASKAPAESTSALAHVPLNSTLSKKELGIALEPLAAAARALTHALSQPAPHTSVTAPTPVRPSSVSKELGISLESLSSSTKSLTFSPSQPLRVLSTAPVNQATLVPSPAGPLKKGPARDMLQSSARSAAEETDPLTPNCQLVLAYVRRESLSHTYTTMQHRSQRKKGPLVWLAVLRLGDRNFVSYPEETATPEEAKEIAAGRAVEELRLHPQAAAPVYPVTPVSSAEQVAVLVNNIARLVMDKPKGILKEGIGPLYEQTFAEQLPPSWFEHVTNSGLVHIESGRHHCILYPLEDADQSAPAKSLQNGHSTEGSRSSSDGNSMGEPDTVTDYVDVFVTCVTSTDNVCFRFIDYDAEYSQLLEDMAAFYSGREGSRADQGTIKVGEDMLYATLHDGRWLRVQAVALHNGGKKVECYFVDEGNTGFLERETLLELDSAFASFPLQAIQCQLDGLTDYAEYDGAADILSDVLLGKTLVAEIINRDEPVSVVMFDTWGPEDVDLNNVVFQRLMGPKLPERGCIGRCHLSHIRSDGLLWIQVNGPGLTVLNNFMRAVNEYCKNNNEGVDKPEFGKVYASQYRADLTYYRAVLTSPEPLPSGEFQLLFVDFGNEDQAYLSELRDLDNLGDFVVRLPFQALQCRLRNLTREDGVNWSDKLSSALLDIIGPDNPELLIRVIVPETDTEPAVVELFTRDPESRNLSCINAVLRDALNL